MTTVETDTDWVLLAECRGRDQSIWFPYESHHGAFNWDRPRRICDVCPVKGECLEWALLNVPYGETGMWGSMTPNERRDLKRERLAVRREARGQVTVCEAAYCSERSRGWSRWCSDVCMRADQRVALVPRSE